MYKMNLKTTIAMTILIGSVGCTLPQAPLMYSSKTTLGIDLSTAVAETGATFNFGFKNHDMIYIPTMVSTKDSNSTKKVQSSTDANTTDTLSIYATFNSNFSSSKKTNLGLGSGINKFVSTGVAAQNLAKNTFLNQCVSYAKDKNATDMLEILKECRLLME